MSYQPKRLVQFIPTYVVHSDYLPTNQVVDAHQTEAQQLLRQYELEKKQGRVNTQRPANFDPRRYVSIRTFEQVKVNQPISENELQARIAKQRQY